MVDIHCVTHWSKLGTTWEGVSLDTLLADLETSAGFALAASYGGSPPTCRWRTSPRARPGSPSATTARS